MKKTRAARRATRAVEAIRADALRWHNGGDVEIHLYARSLRNAAKLLVEKLDRESNPKTAWDACPVITLYKQIAELHLKLLIGEGCNFLSSPTDLLTLHKTHSLRWLAQIVCQIVKVVHWEGEFKCDGVATLSDFSAMINQLETMDPVWCAVESRSRSMDGSVPDQLRPPAVVQFTRNLDVLLDLLDSTADALAATWDLVSEKAAVHVGDMKPTIH